MYSTEYELVLRLLEYYFGRKVAKVGAALLLRGHVPLQRLMSNSHTDFKNIRNSLIILIHHGFAEYSVQMQPCGGRRTLMPVYTINSNRALMYPLLPFGCLMAKKELGNTCYDVLLLAAKCATISQRRLGEMCTNTLGITSNDFMASIAMLKQAGYLTICESFDHRMTAVEVNIRGHDANDPLAAMNTAIYHVMQGAELTGADGPVLRVNIEYIVNHLLKDEIVSLVCKRVGDMPMVRAIMKVLMDNQEDKWPMLVDHAKLEHSVLNVLQTDFNQEAKGEQVVRLLNALNKHPDNLVQYEAVTRSYYLDWEKAMRMLRKKALFGCVRQLCGSKAARVWNLLVSEVDTDNNVMFDAPKVSTRALVSMQTARSILYQLTLHGFAKHHETDGVGVPVTPAAANDRHVLSFSSTIDMTHIQLMKNSFKFASNLLERLEHEKVRIFHSYFVQSSKKDVEGNTYRKKIDTVEAHLFHVTKFLALMQKLCTESGVN